MRHVHRTFRVGFDFARLECRITCTECGRSFYPTKTGRGVYEKFWRKNAGEDLRLGQVAKI